MKKITNEQLGSLIRSAVNSNGPLPADEKFEQIISALRELRESNDQRDEGDWIKCSERMPEIGSNILVYMDEPTHNATPYALASFDKLVSAGQGLSSGNHSHHHRRMYDKQR